jgi:hypothetical protein
MIEPFALRSLARSSVESFKPVAAEPWTPRLPDAGRVSLGSCATLRRVKRLVDVPARGALVGGGAGLVAAVLAGAAQPDQVVLACAVVGAFVGCRNAQRSIGAEPLVQLLLSLLLLRYGSYQLSGDPIVAGLALGLAAVLIAAIVVSWLLRRRARRTASRL